jgi:hypothetical protein
VVCRWVETLWPPLSVTTARTGATGLVSDLLVTLDAHVSTLEVWHRAACRLHSTVLDGSVLRRALADLELTGPSILRCSGSGLHRSAEGTNVKVFHGHYGVVQIIYGFLMRQVKGMPLVQPASSTHRDSGSILKKCATESLSIAKTSYKMWGPQG